MKRALDLARQAAGGVSPRPPVGAVIVQGSEVVGEGATEARPGRHAEVVALDMAGERARGATMYCTLEPHAHQGTAPPCTEAIINAGISRVVCPIEDPYPAVSGNGFRQLRAAGVTIDTDLPPEQVRAAEVLIEGFVKHFRTGMPFVTAKFAMSLDGKIATRTGESQWVTGPAARSAAHAMRATADTIVTGIGTVLADNPRLTARAPDGAPTGRPRLRVIVDTRGRLPSEARLLKEEGNILWVRGEDVHATIEAPNLEAINLSYNSEGGINLEHLFKLLGRRDCLNVMVESGGTLMGGLFDAGLVDKVAAFIAPVVIGGENAPGPVAGHGAGAIRDMLLLDRVEHHIYGSDILVTGYVREAIEENVQRHS
ncbi:MAG: bifunctional diaminohydroxyphosphoribosylaminopyrimidine deaminase/5-amino-6-(5-phosphoribosylamino)uracil reductase RibD [Dehalococcoidia bacterium]